MFVGPFWLEKKIVAPSFLEGVAKYSQDYHEGDVDINGRYDVCSGQ